MNRWLTRLFSTPLAARWLGAFILAAASATAWAAPEYALTGQAPALDKSVLALTSSSQITALDVLMFDEMRDKALATIPTEAWLKPGTMQAAPYRPAMKAGVERLLAYQSLAAKMKDWQPPADQLRVAAFGAGAAVWIEDTVKPQIKIMEVTDPLSGRTSGDIDRYYLGHPEKYLRRLRAQVRYIFMAADMINFADKERARRELEAVATDIQDGKLKFEEAARKFSQAPSAAEGGMLPPFYNGTFFDEFDRQTFAITRVGKTSPVFEGPEGYYLVQLVQTWPPRNIPISEVRDEIRKTLELDDVRHYFNYLLAKKSENRYVQNLSPQWNYLDMTAPIAQIDSLRLTRSNYLRYYGNPIGAGYDTRMPEITANTANWTQGEIVMQDLEAQGKTGNPWIQRALALAALPLRTDAYYAKQIPPEVYSPAKALQTIRDNKQFIQGLRSARLVEFEITPKGGGRKTGAAGATGKAGKKSGSRGATAPPVAPAAGPSEAESTINSIAAQISAGTLPTEPTAVNLADWVGTSGANSDQLASSIQKLQQLVDSTPWVDVRVRIKDKDWVDVVPGTSWYDPLKSVQVGHVSAPLKIGTSSFQYLVVAERAVDLRDWASKPMLTRALAFQIEASKLFHVEVLKIRQSGAAHYTFQ